MKVSCGRMLAIATCLTIATQIDAYAETSWQAYITVPEFVASTVWTPAAPRGESGWVRPFPTDDCALCWRDDNFFGEDPLPDAETWWLQSDVRKTYSEHPPG